MERLSGASARSAESAGGQKRRKVAAEDAGEARQRRKARMSHVRIMSRFERRRRLDREPTLKEIPYVCTLDFASATDEMDNLSSILSGVWSGNSTSEVEATKQFRECYLTEGSPSIEKVIKAATIRRFLEFLKKDDCPELQVEAAWALTGFVSNKSEKTENSLPVEAIDAFVKLLGSPNDDVREQALWALGSVAWESYAGRDLILSHVELFQFYAQLGEDSILDLSMQRTASWALANFRRSDPPPRFEQVRPALRTLDGFLQSSDEEILIDANWALHFIFIGCPDRFKAILDSGVCHRLRELLQHSSYELLQTHSSYELLRLVLLNLAEVVILEEINKEVHRVLDDGGLQKFSSLLSPDLENCLECQLCLDAFFILYHFNDTQAYIKANLIEPLVRLLQQAEDQIKEKAASLLSYVIEESTDDQIRYIGNQGCVRAFSNLLTSKNLLILKGSVSALVNILKVGHSDKKSGRTGDDNVYLEVLRNAGGIEKLSAIQYHAEEDVKSGVQKILNTYYFTSWDKDGYEDEDEGGDECSV